VTLSHGAGRKQNSWVLFLVVAKISKILHATADALVRPYSKAAVNPGM
jgi:hypothetical protein